MNKLAKTVSVVGFALSMIVVSRLLYLLTFRDTQAGNDVFWLTVGTVVIACIAAGLMFYFFLRHGTNKSYTTQSVSLEPAIASAPVNLTATSTAEPFNITRWEQLNPWLIEGQADDRLPMLGSPGDLSGSLSVRRSTARRVHQMMYKRWSQGRRE
jgi:hypothetical protein